MNNNQYKARVYPDTATECKFLLGGIGTGNISIGTRGNYCNWEIFGQPGKGIHFPYTFFSIWAKGKNSPPVVRVLESRLKPPYTCSHGFISGDLAGLPRFKHSWFSAAYPFVNVQLEDDSLPIGVTLEAFTPFIPLNAKDSGIPGAVIRYRVKNHTDEELDATVAGSVANAVGFDGYDLFDNLLVKKPVKNEYLEADQMRGLLYTSPQLPPEDLSNGSMALMTGETEITVKEEWLSGAWWDGIHDFWDDFSEDGRLEFRSKFSGKESKFNDLSDLRIGSLGICKRIPAHGEAVFEFILTWYFPNRQKYWGGHICPENRDKKEMEQNYYAGFWKNAWDCGVYLQHNLQRLEGHSRAFTKALYESTLPDYVIEALANNITVLRSPTCFRISDGTFLSWEGSFPKHGSCEGNCTHVWNYAQTAAFLFPELEQSMRRTEFLLETDEKGCMAFRTLQVFGDKKWDMIPAVDGQMGTILRLYRDWKLGAGDGLLKETWEKAALALDFAFTYWDLDGDFVLDNQQHNTYDIEFYGPNSLSNSLFLAALRAGKEMAEYLGDTEHVRKYEEAFQKGSARTDALLWGGDYYIQVLDDLDACKYQYGTGCLADQVFGQMLAHLNGLGYVLPEEHIKKAIHAVFRNNFRETMEDHVNVQRTYALNQEKGLVLCSWPQGGRPRLPFVYSDEVWSGIEYQVAAHLIFEGFVEEGLTVVKAVRERYNGYDWNPWNEVECGNHYVRSMASWSVLIALSGYRFDLVHNKISFAPAINQDDFRCFFSNAKNWGVYSQKRNSETGELESTVEILYGEDWDMKIEIPDKGRITINKMTL